MNKTAVAVALHTAKKPGESKQAGSGLVGEILAKRSAKHAPEEEPLEPELLQEEASTENSDDSLVGQILRDRKLRRGDK